jgi:alpha-L-rhamnosidase
MKRADLGLILAVALPALASPLAAATSGSGLPISDAVLQRQWTGAWIACPGAPERDPGVFRFRRVIDVPTVPSRFVVHVSADQRFVLHVNGRRVGIGPSRGDILFWRFQTFDLAPFLKAGPNLLTALVWNFGTQAPAAQITDRTGFVVQGDGDAEQVANTDATWECAPEPGHQPWPEGLKPLHEGDPQYLVVGPGERLDASQYDWTWATPPAPGAPPGRRQPAVVSAPATPRTISVGPGYQLTPDGRLLVPDELPPMEYRLVGAGSVVRSEGADVEGFPEKGVVHVPPNAKASLLLDRRTLVTAYPELTFSGGRGARVRIGYQEALLEPGKPWRKGNRGEFEGKRFAGYEDEVLPDGGAGRVFHSLWWRTWRYMRIEVETAGEPLTLDRLAVHFTAYPFEERARFDAGDAILGRLWEVGWRTARSCAHETYVDCPYYEQLQYVGDSYAVAGDDRLARQAIESFERSRRSEGITYSRYPSAPQQFIPPFSLLWVGMVHDYWTWRDDPAFVRRQLAGTRTVLDWFVERRRPDGLLGPLPWWNFVDWCDDFAEGVPPQDADGGSVAVSLQLALALRELEPRGGRASRGGARLSPWRTRARRA